MAPNTRSVRIVQTIAIALVANFLMAGSCGGDKKPEEERTYERYGAGGEKAALEQRAGEQKKGEDEQQEGKNDGHVESSTSSNGKSHKEVGKGEYAVLLTDPASAGRYCWYIEETVRINAGSSKRTGYRNSCIDDETNCLVHEPEGYKRETSSSYLRVGYETVSGGPLAGNCAILDAYWDEEPTVECLYHKHCYGGKKCVDYLCRCLPGDTCTEAGEPEQPAVPDDSSPAGVAPTGGENPDAGTPSPGPAAPPAPGGPVPGAPPV